MQVTNNKSVLLHERKHLCHFRNPLQQSERKVKC